jgi:hypothetical protein
MNQKILLPFESFFIYITRKWLLLTMHLLMSHQFTPATTQLTTDITGNRPILSVYAFMYNKGFLIAA